MSVLIELRNLDKADSIFEFVEVEHFFEASNIGIRRAASYEERTGDTFDYYLYTEGDDRYQAAKRA